MECLSVNRVLTLHVQVRYTYGAWLSWRLSMSFSTVINIKVLTVNLGKISTGERVDRKTNEGNTRSMYIRIRIQMIWLAYMYYNILYRRLFLSPSFPKDRKGNCKIVPSRPSTHPLSVVRLSIHQLCGRCNSTAAGPSFSISSSMKPHWPVDVQRHAICPSATTGWEFPSSTQILADAVTSILLCLFASSLLL